MAIRSMTGYGSAERCAGGTKAAVELGAVNHKQFDLRIFPAAMPAFLESRIAGQIHKRVARGSVTCRFKISFDSKRGVPETAVDEPLAAAYSARLRELAAKLGLKDDLSVSAIAGMPGVLRSRTIEDDLASAQALLFDSLKHALADLIDMRVAEGKALYTDIERRMTRLGTIAARIETRAPCVPKKQMKAMIDRVEIAGLDLKCDDPRLIREVALFADRCDISEEITRLRSHMKQFAGKFSASSPVGRTLDFLVQEMHREINTIGSKANDKTISADVVRFKSELERVREQVQNVE